MAMILVRSPMRDVDGRLPQIAVRLDRQKLARRLWRAVADDGTDFGVEVDVPLRHGDVIWATPESRYVIRQAAEPLLEISIEVPADQAAVIGWAVGNMHFVIEAQARCILAPDDPGLRQALERIGIAYRPISAVFEPHRFASLVGHAHGPHGAAAPVGSHPYIRAARPPG